ncbi:MAG: Rieske (2Fe-2S) protein [Planctomycetota bacterium]
MSSDEGTGEVQWVSVGAPDRLRFDPGAVVHVEGHEVAVFRVPTSPCGYRAVVNSCPHAGAALAEGHQSGEEVACPWHGWRFDLATGACKTLPEDRTIVFPTRVRGGELEIGLPA